MQARGRFQKWEGTFSGLEDGKGVRTIRGIAKRKKKLGCPEGAQNPSVKVEWHSFLERKGKGQSDRVTRGGCGRELRY